MGPARTFFTHSPQLVPLVLTLHPDDYRTHTSCLSEVERYETKGRRPKPAKQTPQQQWTTLLASCATSCPPHLKTYFQTMAALDNVPRKEKQFRNFANNSLNLNPRESQRLLGEIWRVLMDAREQQRQAHDSQSEPQRTVPSDAAEEATPMTLTRDEGSTEAEPHNDTHREETTTVEEPDVSAKTVKKAMKRILKESKEQSLTLKQLRRTLTKHLGLSKNRKEQLKRLIKANLNEKKFIMENKVIRLQVH